MKRLIKNGYWKRQTGKYIKNNVNIPYLEFIYNTQEIERTGKSVCKALIDAANLAIPKTKGIVTIKYNTYWWNQNCEDAVRVKKNIL